MPDNPPTNQIELKILGMTCDSCAVHVQRALESVPEVAEVHVPGWSEGRVTVIVQQPIDDRRLLTAVKDVGYRAEVLKAEKSEELKESSTAFISLPSDEESSYDLVVIGTGGAGMAAAIKGAELGHRVCIIEQGTLGGTCVNIGCIPSKTLIWAASVYHKVNHPPFEGLHFQAPKVDWTTLVHEKEQLVAELRQSKYQDVLAIFRDNITVVRGRARLRADASVQLENGHLFHASKIVIATGARPKVLPVNGVNKTNILTSTSALALKTQPKSLVIIGGRAIALELGQMFARFGTKVTILQRSPRLLPAHDPELAEALATYLQVEGLTIHTNSVPVSIHEENNIKILKANIAGQTREFQTEEVLMAVGRAPNTQDIGLKEAGVEVDDQGFIIVDEFLRTSNPKIFAAGDVTSHPKFVYVAAAAGSIAAKNALTENSHKFDLSLLPDVIFTDPQVATVGLTEQEALAKGLKVQVTQLPLSYVPKALTSRDTRGLIKLVAEQQSNRLLGAHILAANAGELIQTAALAVKFGREHGFTVKALSEMLFPYLVQVEGLKLAAQSFEKDVSQLSCCAG